MRFYDHYDSYDCCDYHDFYDCYDDYDFLFFINSIIRSFVRGVHKPGVLWRAPDQGEDGPQNVGGSEEYNRVPSRVSSKVSFRDL